MVSLIRVPLEATASIEWLVPRVFEQLEQVGPHERLAAGEDQDHATSLGDLVNHPPGLVGCDLLGVSPHAVGEPPAVDAGQVAGLGSLPEDQAGSGRLEALAAGAAGAVWMAAWPVRMARKVPVWMRSWGVAMWMHIVVHFAANS